MELKLICHDGINLFCNGRWTGICWGDMDNAQSMGAHLKELPANEAYKWIMANKPEYSKFRLTSVERIQMQPFY